MVSKKFKNRLLFSSLAALFGFSVISDFRDYQQKVGLEDYLETCAPLIVMDQENRIGIEYNFDINFEVKNPTFNEIYDKSQGVTKRGYYSQEDGIINIINGNVSYPAKNDWSKIIGRYNQKGESAALVLAHEMGHLYTDNRGKELGFDAWPDFSNIYVAIQELDDAKFKEKTIPQLYAGSTREVKLKHFDELTDYFLKKVIAEGIAVYFAKSTIEEANFSDDDWPDNILVVDLDKDVEYYYQGGYSIVKPIIDMYGSDGIDYLILHPPEVDSFMELPDYRDKVIVELREQQYLENIDSNK